MRIPDGYNLFRYIDYHQNNDWAIGFVALSPYNECFVFDELNISPRTNSTEEISYRIAEKSGHYRYKFDVIDPLANIRSGDSKIRGMVTTTIEDINRYMADFKRQGICEGSNFIPADTKGTRGRERIRARLLNSIVVEKPFNNDAEKYKDNEDVVNIDKEPYLPTIWIFSNCKQVRLSLKNWREEKGKPTQAYSHHCTGLEFLMKDKRFRPPLLEYERPRERTGIYYRGVR